ncbi:MAG: hypothetical protein JWN48_4970 [Myxococcaceae bacterium]|nr:hypothetical protein [Myxococcaceae bacterium]
MAAPKGAGALALLLLTGCVEPVALGSQCAELAESCPSTSGLRPADPGAPLLSLDATVVAPPVDIVRPDGAVLGPVLDGSVTLPPSMDGGTALRGLFPELRNPSLELTRGVPGNLAYSPLDPIPLGVNLAEPWSACGFGVSVLRSTDAARGSNLDDVKPTDGPGFVETNLGLPALQGLRQTLGSPMKKDVRYSFMVDVRAAVGADVTLEVWGSFVDCVGAVKLTDLGNVPEVWQTKCVAFVPPMDLPQLFLQPSVRSSDTNADLRMFFDNLRSDPRCP